MSSNITSNSISLKKKVFLSFADLLVVRLCLLNMSMIIKWGNFVSFKISLLSLVSNKFILTMLTPQNYHYYLFKNN